MDQEYFLEGTDPNQVGMMLGQNVGQQEATTASTVPAVSDEDAALHAAFERVKTHFPPAKIKKIMQTDEDIGKVSQATPVIAGRSLEFFLAMLVKKSVNVAKQMGTKRITADVLKQTIMTDEKFDFLRENVCGATAADEEEGAEKETETETNDEGSSNGAG